jgi:AcrR family transcriptional regulator
MLVKMGRPKEHDERTAEALLDAAERTVERDGVAGLSLRSVARDAGTTTRAVYSLFGSKDGLVTALGARAFELLRQGLDGLPPTTDPQRDLVDAALMFRRFARDHPVLFSIGIQRTLGGPEHWSGFLPVAMGTLEVLESRFERLDDAGLLAGRTTREAAFEFHALCEGLTTCELRGLPPSVDAERLWRDGISALVAGLATAAV